MIKIAQRLRIFSKRLGACCLLPSSFFKIQSFPGLLKVKSLHNLSSCEIAFDVKGPVRDFTMYQDLEKGYVKIWGFALNGYFRYRIIPLCDSNAIEICFEKTPVDGIGLSIDGIKLSSSVFIMKKENQDLTILNRPVFSRDNIIVSFTPINKMPNMVSKSSEERLSLGLHKALDFDLIARRKDLKEYLPILFRMSTYLPISGCIDDPLAIKCRKMISLKKRCEIEKMLWSFIAARFDEILVPTFFDYNYQGIEDSKMDILAETSPLLLIEEAGKLIRSLFIQEVKNNLYILPSLPISFHCGRFINIRCSCGIIDIEWSKKLIRRMVLRSTKTEVLYCHFQKKLKTLRLRCHMKDKGKRVACVESINLEKGKVYFMDNFEK